MLSISCQKSWDVVHRKKNHPGIVLESIAQSDNDKTPFPSAQPIFRQRDDSDNETSLPLSKGGLEGM